MKNTGSTLVAMYGNKPYEPVTCRFPESSGETRTGYPGLAILEYLTRIRKVRISSIVLLGTESSAWFSLLSDFREFFRKNSIAFPYADQVLGTDDVQGGCLARSQEISVKIGASPAQSGSESSADQKLDATMHKVTDHCTPEELDALRKEINSVLEQHFRCSLTVLIHSGSLGDLSAQTDVISQLFGQADLLRGKDLYLDITCGFRFVPLLVLSALKCLQNTGILRIRDIFYVSLSRETPDTSLLLSHSLINSIFDESVCHALFTDSMRLQYLAETCQDDPQLAQQIKQADQLLNIQDYREAGEIFGKFISPLKEKFQKSGSVIFTGDFLDQIYLMMRKDRSLLMQRYADLSQIFNAVMLAEFMHSQGQFLTTKNGYDKFRAKFRNQILHFTNADSDAYSADEAVNDLKNDLRNFLRNKCGTMSTPGQETKEETRLPVMFTFLGSGGYTSLSYEENEFGIRESKFIANALAAEYFKKGEISRYCVIGTFTSNWNDFLDYLLDLQTTDEGIDAMGEIETVFRKQEKKLQNGTPAIVLNREAVDEINALLIRHQDALGQKLEIFAYDEPHALENSYEEIRAYLDRSIGVGQHFILDISHCFRNVPIITLMTLLSFVFSKNAELDRLWYSWSMGGPGARGKLLDLTYLVRLLRHTRSIALFNRSEDPSYLLPMLEDLVPGETDLLSSLREGAEYESLLHFRQAWKCYQKAAELLGSLDLDSDQTLSMLKLGYPLFRDRLTDLRWTESITTMAECASRYINDGRYSMAICALYEAYNMFPDMLMKTSFSRHDLRHLEIQHPFCRKFERINEICRQDLRDYQEELVSNRHDVTPYNMQACRNRDILEEALKLAAPGARKNVYNCIKDLRRLVTSEVGYDSLDSYQRDPKKEGLRKLFPGSRADFREIRKLLEQAVRELRCLDSVYTDFQKDLMDLEDRLAAQSAAESNSTSEPAAAPGDAPDQD